MAGWCLVLVVVVSAQIIQSSIADPKVQDQVYHDSKDAWRSQEQSCSKESCSVGNSGALESLIDDLHSKIRDAEIELVNQIAYPPHYHVKDGEEFDFIVVGAGSAGAVLANRLSEVEEWKVLLVEAGGDPPVVSEVPVLAPTLQGTDVDWKYKTDSEENNCLGMKGNQCAWPRGKVLGGSSTTNFMMHTRGTPRDYDSWAAAGNKGWSYEQVLPYFKKSEDTNDRTTWMMQDAEKYHNTGGLLSIEPWPDSEDVKVGLDAFADGMEELGYPYNPDVNGNNQTGFTKMPAALRGSRRCSTAKAFLSSAKERENLFVSKHTLATKILIEVGKSKAYGIHLTTKDGKNLEVRAKKEVIVSAGAINSPQLLILSGIGPKLHLHKLGIPVIKDLPVGENLQDHPLMTTIVITTNLSDSIPPPNFKDTFNFLFNQPSRLTSTGSFAYASYVNVVSDVDHPDMELLQHHIPKNSKHMMIPMFSSSNYRSKSMEDYIKVNENSYMIMMFASMMRPHSRGRISLQSKDPNTHPKIVSGTLSDKRDVDLYLKTYDFISRLIDTEALKRVDAKFHEIRVLDCEKHQLASPEYRECAMRHLTATTYHYCGTCKMGPAEDPSAVVDCALRVHGVRGLRVVDASVMPTIVSAHINAAVVMVGEKAADMIKQDWKT